MSAFTITGNNQNNQLWGSSNDELMLGLQGDDILIGASGNDTLIGGAGNDRLHGDNGNNTYVFNRGDGLDTIHSHDATSTKQNTIAFGLGVAPADIHAIRDNDDLRLINSKTGDAVVVDNFFSSYHNYDFGPALRPWAIEKITFETGETWFYSDILKLVAEPARALGPGHDYAYGAHLLGREGDDTLHASGAAVLDGGAGDDRLFGSFADDLLVGGAGNDVLEGRGGNDLFIFGRGAGQDRVDLRDDGGSAEIRLEGMLPGELALARSGSDLVLTSKTGPDSITLGSFFADPNSPYGQYGSGPGAKVSLVFADGSSWTGPQIEGLLHRPPGMQLTGSDADDQLVGGAYDDVLTGGGGSDHLSGEGGNDVLVGGAGTDMLVGGEGSDTYLPGAGDAYIHDKDGHNLVQVGREAGTYRLFDVWQTKSMTLAMAADIAPDDIDVIRPNDGTLHIVIAGSPARIIVDEMLVLGPAMGGQLSIVFSDGQVWSGASLRSQVFRGGDQEDYFRGTYFGDLMQGYGGRDMLEGMEGDDRLFGGDGDDLLLGMQGADALYGGDGNDELYGHEGDDFLAGGAGMDMLFGGAGHNTYQFGRLDHVDVIHLSPYHYDGKGSDTVEFESGINAADITVSYDSETLDLTLSTPYKQETVVLRGFQFDAGPGANDVFVRFADGTTWDRATLRERTLIGDEQDNSLVGGANADLIVGHDGEDKLLGNANDDTLNGGHGNDRLDGGEGRDTYLFNKGDGKDALFEFTAAAQHTSVFRFGPDVAAGDLRANLVGTTLYLHYGLGDAIVIDNFYPGQSYASFILSTQIELVVGAPTTLGAYLPLPNRAPLANVPMPDLLVQTYRPFYYTIPADAFRDDDAGDTSALSVTLANGSPLPKWLAFDPATRTLQGKAELADSGVLALTVTSTDSAKAAGTAPLKLAVNATAPVVKTPVADAVAKESTPFSLRLEGQTFYDPDYAEQLTLALTLANGTALPAWLQYSKSDSALTLSGTPAEADVGVLDLLFTATDKLGMKASDAFRLTINDVNRAPVISAYVDQIEAYENAAFSGAAPRFTDPDAADKLSVTVTMNDGAPLPTWISYNAATGMLSGTPTFADSGMYSLRASASDGALTAESAFTVYVHNTNRAPTMTSAIADLALQEGVAFTAALPSFADPDSGEYMELPPTITVTMADGAALPGWMSFKYGANTLAGTPGYEHSGSYALTATATDAAGLKVSSPFAVMVANTNRAPLVSAELAPIAALEGAAFSSAGPAFADPDTGDVLSYTVALAYGGALPTWLQFDPATGRLYGTPTFNSSGAYVFTTRVTDGGTLTASSKFELIVADVNQAPVLSVPVPDQSATDGTTFKFTLPTGTFSDADTGDSGALSVTGLPAWLTFTAATGSFSGIPSGSDLGDVALGVRFTDGGGLFAQDSFIVTVAQAAPVHMTGTAGANVLTGRSGADTLSGLGGDDVLDGALGADRMLGGLGNDVYHVDNAADVVLENAAEGTDSVISTISYTLPANVEKLTLAGTAALNASGNGLANTLTGNSGANLLDGGAGNDSLAGGDGNDIYMVDSTYDTVTEASASGGFDQVISLVGRTLGVHQEVLTLTGTASISGTGNAAANLIQGNSGANSLAGGDGSDILQGGAGNDTLSDSSLGGNLFDGGAGADRLTGNSGADMFIGGAGNDTIATGSGADVMAFNRGDGVDSVAVTSGTDNTVSLGRGIRYADLALGKSGNDLVLHVGAGESITFNGWYSSTNARSVGVLQVLTEGGDYAPGSASAISDHKVELFNFTALVAKFDQARASAPGLSTWEMVPSLGSFSSGGSDSAAIGGDLAYAYGVAGSLSGLAAAPALAIIGSPTFGASQALQGGSALNDGTSMLY